MSKYGSCVSMRGVIKAEVNEVREILARSGLTKEDRDSVMGALKEMAWQWCKATAAANAQEEVIRARVGDDVYMQMLTQMVQTGRLTEIADGLWPYGGNE